jgi:small subunit ribosomal protein S3
LGVIKSWNSKWFAGKNFADFITEDIQVKRYINTRLDNAGLARVEILRAPKKVTVDIHTSRPGIVIGRKGAEVDKLREELQLLTKKDISLNIIEVKKPELNARLVADSIARQLEGRVSYRRAMKKSIQTTMKMGADGVKIICAGRLGGAEIARSEKYMDGRVPLHTLRANIDYATSTAHTTYGCIGVKVWICRGMVHGAGEMEIRDDMDKSAGERADLEIPSRRDRKGAERPRKRRPRGRVRRARTDGGGPEGGRPEGGRPSGGRGSDRDRRPARPARGKQTRPPRRKPRPPKPDQEQRREAHPAKDKPREKTESKGGAKDKTPKPKETGARKDDTTSSGEKGAEKK